MKNRLTATAVKNAKPGPLRADGGGLYLKSTTAGKSWIFRWRDRTTGKLRDMGLGSVDDFTLAEARDAARDARRVVHSGRDPIQQRQIERAERQAAAASMLTFDQAAARFIADKVEPTSKNEKHVSQWRNTLRDYASPVIGSLPVHMVTDQHVLQILEKIWTSKNKTASRLRGRVESVLDWATVRKYRSGPNPARWAGHMQTLLPSPGKVQKVQHMASLPYAEMNAFMVDLRKRNGTGARALEFAVLTAARSGEVRGMVWDEVDLVAKVWTIPGSRMKAGKEHRVPLSARAVEILEGQKGKSETLVFPGPKGNALSDSTLVKVLRDMKVAAVPHGFRASFRNWCAEQTSYPHDLLEMALAHTISNQATAAYLHSDMIEKRRALMTSWSTYISTKPGGSVTQIGAAKKA